MLSKDLKVSAEPEFSRLTTLGLGGKGIALVKILAEEGLNELPDLLQSLGGRSVLLGRGSNILVASDDPVPLVLLQPELGPEPRQIDFNELSNSANDWAELDFEEADRNGLRAVEVGAGARLPIFLNQLATWGLGGLAGLAGIPGSIGGSIAMNAGSYGVEISKFLLALRVFVPGIGIKTIAAKDINFSYRHFSLPANCANSGTLSWFMVCRALFALPSENPEQIRIAMQEKLQRKKKTQPVQAKSAGCVFKNPMPVSLGGSLPTNSGGISAGKLLDEAGFKGKRLGGMAFSDLHANFLLNTGKGKAVEAMELLAQAQDKVFATSGHKLQMEVRVWP